MIPWKTIGTIAAAGAVGATAGWIGRGKKDERWVNETLETSRKMVELEHEKTMILQQQNEKLRKDMKDLYKQVDRMEKKLKKGGLI